MVKDVLVTFDLKNEGVPRIFASYILTDIEWSPIKDFLENENLEIVLKDSELTSETIIIDYTTLKIVENYNIKYINAFKTLYKNHFFNYDLLLFIRDKMCKPVKKKTMKDFFMDDDNDDNDDLDYYMNEKKNTPEFSNLDDKKIKELIMETKKTINLFKPIKD